MIIYDISKNSKYAFLAKIFIPSLIILINCSLFGGWKLLELQKARKPAFLDTSAVVLRSSNIPNDDILKTPAATTTVQMTGKYVASRGGTTYHLPTCSGAKRISEKNKIYFHNKEEAERFGYKPAKNCKGI
ncbi:hypothetical protein H0W32_00780 [Patescibacteria group bacterium]|nr:hypothetical protein [Patescibacteria group bacterium]